MRHMNTVSNANEIRENNLDVSQRDFPNKLERKDIIEGYATQAK